MEGACTYSILFCMIQGMPGTDLNFFDCQHKEERKTLRSVKTEADFCPLAGAGAHARKLPRPPAVD